MNSVPVRDDPGVSDFQSWLLAQSGRDDPVGDLANDLRRDMRVRKLRGRPLPEPFTPGSFRRYLTTRTGACAGAFEALAQAGREWRQQNRCIEADRTFAELCQIEPRLAELMPEVQAVKDPGGEEFCANDLWYLSDGFKNRLCRLVGWHAEKAELRTSAAYDIAYDELYKQLPDCRNCRCIRFEIAMGLSPDATGGGS